MVGVKNFKEETICKYVIDWGDDEKCFNYNSLF